MYKALLIDDEPWILKDLELLVDWNKLGFEVITKISNSREAVQLIKKQQPDLIVCDIKMPGLNGIELMKLVKRDFPGIYVVFVSAYSEFTYAKEAIELGAFDYILKPTKDKELRTVLKRVSSHLGKDNEEKKKLEKYRKTELFLELLENNLEEQIIMKKLNNIGYDIAYDRFCVVIVNCLANNFTNEYWQSQLKDCFSSFKLLFIQFGFGEKKWLILCNFSSAVLTDSRCFKKAGLIADKYKLSIGVSNSFNNLIDLKHYYKEAELLSYNHFIYKKGGIYKYSMYNSNYIELSTKIKGLTSCSDLKSFVGKLPELLTEERINLEAIAYLYNRLQEKANALCNLSFEIELLDPLDIIYLFNNLQELFEQLLGILTEKKGSERVSHDIVEKVIKEIRQKYNKNLSLQDLAVKHHINYNYLSQLFKKETGQTFTNYLIELRIKKAIKLFSKDLLFYQIARKVGYDDYYHFCKIFKKHKGLSPSEFKKKYI
ncbi:MAG: response regulator [Firmicutes bacterium]|nr:response regulator [Bacillota bacterium]